MAKWNAVQPLVGGGTYPRFLPPGRVRSSASIRPHPLSPDLMGGLGDCRGAIHRARWRDHETSRPSHRHPLAGSSRCARHAFIRFLIRNHPQRRRSPRCAGTPAVHESGTNTRIGTRQAPWTVVDQSESPQDGCNPLDYADLVRGELSQDIIRVFECHSRTAVACAMLARQCINPALSRNLACSVRPFSTPRWSRGFSR